MTRHRRSHSRCRRSGGIAARDPPGDPAQWRGLKSFHELRGEKSCLFASGSEQKAGRDPVTLLEELQALGIAFVSLTKRYSLNCRDIQSSETVDHSARNWHTGEPKHVSISVEPRNR
jgi:hypothetical protein